MRLAVAGNVIDFGCRSNLDNDEVYEAIDDAMNNPLGEVGVAGFCRPVDEVGNILYLADKTNLARQARRFAVEQQAGTDGCRRRGGVWWAVCRALKRCK
jgi:hypothetical protein